MGDHCNLLYDGNGYGKSGIGLAVLIAVAEPAEGTDSNVVK